MTGEPMEGWTVTAVFHRSTGDAVDEVRIYSWPDWPFCVARRVDHPTDSAPKLDFLTLSGMLTFCGYVRQDAP